MTPMTVFWYRALGVNGLQRFSYLLSRDGFFQVLLFIQMDGGPIDNFLKVDITMTTLHFVDPVTGCHTNRQEGLWKHVRDGVSGSRSLEDSFVDFLVKRKFTLGGCSRGTDRIVRVFNGYLAMLKLFNDAIV